MTQKIFFLVFLCLNLITVTAQLTNKNHIADQIDTNQIKNNILEFTRLTFTKSKLGIDSLVKFCSSPFYNNDWQAKKIFNSALALKTELNEIFRKEKYKPVSYSTEALFKSDSCVNKFLKSNQYICFKMTTYILNIGEGNYTALLKTTFYIENKFPNRILGLEENY